MAQTVEAFVAEAQDNARLLQTGFGTGAVLACIAVVLVIAAFAVTQLAKETKGLALDAIAAPTG